jgi:hypothetical protein
VGRRRWKGMLAKRFGPLSPKLTPKRAPRWRDMPSESGGRRLHRSSLGRSESLGRVGIVSRINHSPSSLKAEHGRLLARR